MDRFEAAFLEEIPPIDRPRVGTDLGIQIEAACARCRSAFPGLFARDEAFARYLALAIRRWSNEATIGNLFVEDLYLAYACFTGVPQAANIFFTRYGDVIRRTIERVAGRPNAEEIAQALISDLLVGSASSVPEIGDYAACAPLVRWLEVVAQRAALRWLRTERAKGRVAERASLEARLGRETPNELALFRERYGDAFEQALKGALQRAPKQDRAILRLRLVNNISVEKIGKMLGMSQPTASRRLAKARGSLLIDLKTSLKERLGISSTEIASLAALLQSRLDLSLSRLLGSDDGVR
jgi:RNA polymerase sigma-70 factor, ECF subfamily